MAETKKENWFKKTWKRICKFFRELKSELKKVVWPTWGQVLKNALTVVVCVLIVGVFIWIFDMGAKYGIQALAQGFQLSIHRNAKRLECAARRILRLPALGRR